MQIIANTTLNISYLITPSYRLFVTRGVLALLWYCHH